jgi:hypothetical protein
MHSTSNGAIVVFNANIFNNNVLHTEVIILVLRWAFPSRILIKLATRTLTISILRISDEMP